MILADPPQLSLTTSERRPREGDNVTLRCEWSANPAVAAVWWRHDGRLLDWRDEALHLANVTRTQTGLYECLASNRLGEGYSNQLLLSVLSPPANPHNCSASRKSGDSVTVKCVPGSSGGLPVTFFAELLVAPSLLLGNATASRWPEFDFSGLPLGGTILVRVYAANCHGVSGAAEIRFALRVPPGAAETAATTDPSGTNVSTHVLGFLTAVVVILVFAALCLVMHKYRKHRRKRKGTDAFFPARHG
ncbi:hypothetical protein V5799_024341 [Amblyomma americanum]|uniref:Uncharacterized protein n=1 Tax=Amblyomma americanum TaxID=6943 RepID=A0AAQ4ECK7_AMBAM